MTALPRKPRLVILSPVYFPYAGGAEKGIYDLARGLGAWFLVTVVAPHANPRTSSHIATDEWMDDARMPFRVVRIPARWTSGPEPLWPDPPRLSWLRTNLRIARLVRSLRPDVVNLHYPLLMGPAALVLEKVHRIPVMAQTVGRDCRLADLGRGARRYARVLFRRLAHPVFVSQFARKEVEAITGPLRRASILPYPVNYLPDGVRDGDSRALRKALAIPPGAFAFLCIQRLSWWKRVDVIIDAFAIVQRRHPQTFLIVGGKGEAGPELSAQVQRLGIEQHVRLTGYLSPFDHASSPKVSSHLWMADGFVFHSRYETFGIALIEALAAGLPTVCADSTAGPELVQHEKNGLLAQPMDTEGIARQMLRILEEPELRDRIAAGARAVAREYALPSVAGRYARAFLQAMGREERLPPAAEGEP